MSDADEPGFDAKLVKTLSIPTRSLAWTRDGRRIAFVERKPEKSWETGNLYVWDIDGGASPLLLARNIEENMQSGSFSPDGRHLFVVDTNRSVVTFDLATGKSVASFPTVVPTQAWSRTMKLCLSPDGTRLAMSSPSARGVDLWESYTGRLLYALPEQIGTILRLAWSPDGQRLAVARSNGDIAIWNLPEIERVLAGLGLSP